jgi:hypothetical protein
LIIYREHSEFLKFINGADIDENTFEDNKMYGGNARSVDLPERAVEHLERPPQISVADAGPGNATKELAGASVILYIQLTATASFNILYHFFFFFSLLACLFCLSIHN